MSASFWLRVGVAFWLAAVLAACGTTPAVPPKEQVVPALPQVDTPQENASPAEALGTQPAEEQPKVAGDAARPAESEAPMPEIPEPPSPYYDESLLAQTRRSVRSTTEWLARGVDSWFGDQPFEQGRPRVTDGRVGLSLLKRSDERIDFKLRFNARVRLPNAEKRTYLFLGRDNDRETVADTPGALSRENRLLTETREDRTFFAGFGYALLDAFDLRLGFHGIKPYAQARYRRAWQPTDADLIEARQTFFWRTSERFGTTTALSYEHAYSSTLAFRWLSAVTRTQKSGQFDWSSIVGLYKGFGDEYLLSTEYTVSGAQHAFAPVAAHGPQVKWSQPVYEDWLFCESIAGMYWVKRFIDHPREKVFAFGTALTMRF